MYPFHHQQVPGIPSNSLPPSYNEVMKDDNNSEEPPPSYLESLIITLDVTLRNSMANTEESNDPVQV